MFFVGTRPSDGRPPCTRGEDRGAAEAKGGGRGGSESLTMG